MKRTLILFALAIGLATTVGSYYLMHHRNSQVQEKPRAVESGVPTWNEAEARAAVTNAEAAWKAAADSWSAGNLTASFRDYHRAISVASTWTKHHSDKELTPGVSLRRWADEHDQRYRAAVLAELDVLFARIASGDMPYPEAKTLFQNFEQVGFKDPQQRFQQEESKIADARARAAKRWFRVVVLADYADYEQRIVEALRANWNERYGCRMVFGPAMTPAEEKATWKTVTVEAHQQYARYEIKSKDLQKPVPAPAIPESVQITFTLVGDATVPTTWDKLDPIAAKVELPEQIMVKIKSGEDANAAETLRQQKQQELIGLVKSELDGLKHFQLFPGVDPESLALRKGNQVDKQAAFALSWLDPQRFEREFGELTRDNHLMLRSDLLGLAIQMELEPFAPWVAKNLPTVSPEKQLEMVAELKKRPWYGNYEPLLAVIEYTSMAYPAEAVEALQGQFGEKKVRDLILRKINVTRSAPRRGYATVFTRESPMEEVDKRVAVWLKEKDPEFSTQIYHTLLQRDAARATKLMYQCYDQAPHRTQTAMLQSFRFTPTGNDDPAIPFLLKVARQTANYDARNEARKKIRETAYLPACWDALLSFSKEEINLKTREEMERTLALNARRAHPETADEYFITLLRGKDAEQRGLALHELLGSEGPKHTVFRELTGLVTANPKDGELLKQIIFCVHQYHSIRPQWQFGPDQVDLKGLLELGARHPESQVRRNSYNVMAFALKKGEAHWQATLKAALAAEKSESLRQEFSKVVSESKQVASSVPAR